jgi:lipoprotein-anchoring transpeptidase ErfK/SrfK
MVEMLKVASCALTLMLAASGAADAKVVISIDKDAQRMSVLVDGVPRYNWAVSTGRPGYDTPTGDFQAFRMEKDHFSKEWDDAPMPYSIFFTEQGHAIHGSYQTKRLGSAVSHGCVRIAPGNAAKLFALVKAQGLANTEVVVAGSDSGYLDLGSTGGQESAHPGAVLGPVWSKYYDPDPGM